MKHRDKLLKRIKSDTFLKNLNNEGVRYDTMVEIQSFVDKRVFNKITQQEMSLICNVSVATIKRFESLKIDSLELYLIYKVTLSELPNKVKRKIPNWVAI